MTTTSGGSKALATAIAAGNVNIAGAMHVEDIELSKSSKAEFEAHSESLQRYEVQKRARGIIVPTAVDDVKAKLRELAQPVTLFGEGNFDRRERLKIILAQQELNAEGSKGSTEAGNNLDRPGHEQQRQQQQQNGFLRQKNEAVYTNALPELVQARSFLFDFSLQRASSRLDSRRLMNSTDEEGSTRRSSDEASVQALYAQYKDLVLSASASAEERPLVVLRASTSGALLATGSLGTTVKLWDPQLLEQRGSLRGHTERIMSLAWHPQAGLVSDAPELVASSSADGLCILWDCRELKDGTRESLMMEIDGRTKGSERGKELRRFSGHVGPVADCAFHPSGRFIGTAGHDNTWRLWDVETGQELLLQDGHVKECVSMSFQIDGALCLTADAAGVALLWDLRSGQVVHVCQGHVGKISAVSFHPNSFQAASSGVDNTIRIWDFRKRKCVTTLQAHSLAISDLRYSASGEILLSSSFDATIKLWGTRDLRLLRTLMGHSGKVMSADISQDERFVVSAGFDKTLKRWAQRD